MKYKSLLVPKTTLAIRRYNAPYELSSSVTVIAAHIRLIREMKRLEEPKYIRAWITWDRFAEKRTLAEKQLHVEERMFPR